MHIDTLAARPSVQTDAGCRQAGWVRGGPWGSTAGGAFLISLAPRSAYFGPLSRFPLAFNEGMKAFGMAKHNNIKMRRRLVIVIFFSFFFFLFFFFILLLDCCVFRDAAHLLWECRGFLSVEGVGIGQIMRISHKIRPKIIHSFAKKKTNILPSS